MVIDKQIWIENNDSKSVDSVDNKTIDKIVIDGVDYHFASESSVTGVETITCENSVNEPLINMQIQGNSIQDGTPTPETPIEIQSVGENTKNLFDKNNTTYGQNTFWNTINGKLSPSQDYYASQKIPIKENTRYTRSNTNTIANIFWDKDGNYLSVAYSNPGTIINTPEGARYVGFNIPNSIDPSEIQLNEGEILLDYEPYGYKIPVTTRGKNLFNTDNLITSNSEEGSSATTYESYLGAKTYNIYLDEPLRKVGDYADYIEISNGVAKVVRNIREYIFTGTEKASTYNTNTADKSRVLLEVPDVLLGIANNVNSAMSNYYPEGSANSVYSCIQGISVSSKTSKVAIYDEHRQTAESLKSFLEEQYNNGSPVKVLYAKATPTEETIEMPEISTFDGTNIFDVETTIKPSQLTVGYWKQI